MPDDIRRPGVYAAKTSAPNASPAPPSAQPQPSSTPQGVPAPVLNPNDPADQIARQMLDEMPEAATPEERVKQVQEARAKAQEYVSLTPAERWLRNIKNAGLKESAANEILDSVLERGYWEKEYDLYNGRLKVTLRSRDAAANQRVANALDDVRSYDQLVVNQARLRIQLACSLVRYRDKSLPIADVDATPVQHDRVFSERLAFCDRSIAAPVLDALYRALIDFDAKTYAALSEGASSGF